MRYDNEIHKSIKNVPNTFAGYEPSNENQPFSIENAYDVPASLINITSAVLNHKYYKNGDKQIVWLGKLMKAHDMDYLGE